MDEIDDKSKETKDFRRQRIMEEQGKMAKDLGDIEHMVEDDARERRGSEVLYFEPIYKSAKRMRDKLITDLKIESGL